MNLVAQVSTLSDNLEIPVEDLPERINRLRILRDNINIEIKELILKMNGVITSFDVLMWRRNKPPVETPAASAATTIFTNVVTSGPGYPLLSNPPVWTPGEPVHLPT